MGLTIRVVDGPKATTSCGEAILTVEWQLDPGDTGYVVQHIIFTFRDHSCGTPPPKKPVKYEYYEAWQVVKGVVAANGTDYFVLPDQGQDTLGTDKIEGHVKFLPNFTLPKSFKPGSIKPAGGLPAGKNPPAGWTDAGAADHNLEVTWNCCPFERTKPVVTGTPSPKVMPRPQPPPKGRTPGSRVAKTIHDIPPWAPTPKAQAAAIEKQLAPLRNWALADMRRGIELYIAHQISIGAYGIEEMSRLFLVNRYVLAIPEELPRAEDRAFGGWLVPPGRSASPLWPFSMHNGKLKLTGRFHGYTGAPYDALGEFDHFLHYGPRWRQRGGTTRRLRRN